MRARGSVRLALLTAGLIAIAQCCALLLAGVWLATRPAVFDRYYSLLVTSPNVHDARQVVLWLNSSGDIEALSNRLVERRLSPKELSHFADVRAWLRKVPLSILACAGVCFALWF